MTSPPLLRSRGHEATRLAEALPRDTPDSAVWAHARGQSLIVISCNRQHFLALALTTPQHLGLIILNRRHTRQAEAARLLTLIKNAGEQGLTNNINFA